MKKQAMNPFLPSYEYVPDGEPYVFGERVYIYGSHDRFNGTQYCQNNYVCWSAPVDDLASWRYEGVIYDKMEDPLCTGEDRLLFAPDVARGADGRYYLYYAFDFAGFMSVAVCDEPAGTYHFYGHVQDKAGGILGKRPGDCFQFDPGVLVDDDGSVYLYSGFCPADHFFDVLHLPTPELMGPMVIELERDMKTIRTEPRSLIPWIKNCKGTDFEAHPFFEASSIRKVGRTYYFIYSSFHGHELCYATSLSPVGDFAFGGTIISNGDIYLHGRTDAQALNYTGNNHGSIVEIAGQWYVFYHRQTNRHQFSRQACAERIVIDEEGRIAQVEMTSCGLNGGPLRGEGEYEARIACNLMSRNGAVRYEFGEVLGPEHPYFTQEGEDREDHPNQYIANMTDGARAIFKYFDLASPKRIAVRVRGKAEGRFRVTAEEAEAAVIPVHAGTEWTWYSADMAPLSGVHALQFVYTGSGSADFERFCLEQ
ncbi:MAG: family 43 glycosylhydrolase [Clostridia bacterium]|nr:family 43 glycosylhydrolase [Clostridia bacterium]MBR1684467.1 family 43 glycosylhydrolase [Clostridia bacterium]MBR2289028.1 family 43 glycosylhydrolase [Clostridia bacterium]